MYSTFVLPNSDPCIHKEVRAKLYVKWTEMRQISILWTALGSTSLKDSFACCSDKKGEHHISVQVSGACDVCFSAG